MVCQHLERWLESLDEAPDAAARDDASVAGCRRCRLDRLLLQAAASIAAHPTDEELGLYLDGALDQAHGIAVRTHLDVCPECARAAAELQELVLSVGEPEAGHLVPRPEAALPPGGTPLRAASAGSAAGAADAGRPRPVPQARARLVPLARRAARPLLAAGLVLAASAVAWSLLPDRAAPLEEALARSERAAGALAELARTGGAGPELLEPAGAVPFGAGSLVTSEARAFRVGRAFAAAQLEAVLCPDGACERLQSLQPLILLLPGARADLGAIEADLLAGRRAQARAGMARLLASGAASAAGSSGAAAAHAELGLLSQSVQVLARAALQGGLPRGRLGELLPSGDVLRRGPIRRLADAGARDAVLRAAEELASLLDGPLTDEAAVRLDEAVRRLQALFLA